ncbi:MAG: sugar ABC transporter permease, partial [Lachnospiraceae bacterium]|nr:sugar ABC transporter permease [Lachnospiraceae bacterium]
LCSARGVKLFETEGNWVLFFRAAASVMLTTFALSLNLNSGRFDFSIGSVSLLSSVISASICTSLGLPTIPMLIISIAAGAVLGLVSGLIYVIVKLPPIIVSLGVALFYEGLAFAITNGYGVSFVANTELTSFPSVLNYVLIILFGLLIFIFLFDHTKFGYEYKALVSGQKVAVNTGIKEVPNAILCYTIAGALMGVVGFIRATQTGTIQMSLNFGSIGVMFTAFLPMFIGGFIGRFCNEKIGYLLGAITPAFISLMYARLNVDASIQQIVTALILVCFLIYLNNENKVIELVTLKQYRNKKTK